MIAYAIDLLTDSRFATSSGVSNGSVDGGAGSGTMETATAYSTTWPTTSLGTSVMRPVPNRNAISVP